MSIETNNRIANLERDMDMLRKIVEMQKDMLQQLLDQAAQTKPVRETLSLKKLFNGSNG